MQRLAWVHFAACEGFKSEQVGTLPTVLQVGVTAPFGFFDPAGIAKPGDEACRKLQLLWLN